MNQKSIFHCFPPEPSLSYQLQDQDHQLVFTSVNMHFSIYLLSVLLVAISTDGLGLPPGWWCGTKPCDARMKEREDSRINNRAMSNTTAIDTAVNNTAVTGRPTTNTGPSRYTISCGWWCAVKKRQIGNPNTSNEASAAPPSRQALAWTCGERTCPLDLEPLKNENLNSTAINNTAVTTTPINNSPKGSCGWWCRAKKRQISKKNISKKASTERQIDFAASEASESS